MSKGTGGISGGGSREWLQPQDMQGNLRPEDGEVTVRGCHRGFYTGLNVVNPQPDFEYQWVLKDPNKIRAARMRGWRQVAQDDPEMSAWRASVYGEDDSDQPTPLDTTDTFNELVFMKIPSAQLAEIREEQEAERIRRTRGGPDQAWMSGARADEVQAGYGRPTRFIAAQHSQTITENDAPVETWTPDRRGIISEE